ncbi:MAG: monovalent cation/H(+) antiporter subunit G [Pseudomonadota bacterium]
MIEIIAGIAVLIGAAFTLIAGLGILRLPDVLIRMHASTKTGTLGVGMIMLGIILLHIGEWSVVLRAVAVVLFLLLTAPIGAHMIGRAALKTGVKLWRPPGRED